MKFSIATAWIDPSELPAIAREADRLGYDSIAVSDHVVNIEELRTPYPYSADGERRWKSFDPWVDPMVAIGALGAVTERIRFFTNVYVLPMRDPFTTAKTVATASIFTGGRVSLGIGMGWCEDEFDLIGQQFRRRGARSDEMLELLATLWQGGWVEHHGEFYDVPRLEMTPPPPAPIPILVGGMSDAALRRAARHNGWISDLISTDDAAGYIARIDAMREETDRHGDFDMVVSLSDAVTVDQFRRAEEVGVTNVLTMPWVYYGGFDLSLAQKLEGMGRFAEEIMAPLTS
ncbi:MAG: TIGR03619 family F420-dependent LLM class oxidoreductase [Microthrixaceae bacterium]|nr:TIGR03619 family F420-dependent LLM class oxidoreductase [Acidimicrobiales bacterium]MCB9404110.1 TIGR03619 family F420-dependent LLM class oxidoreductase [Microthrixaceae bacterium]